MLLLFDQTTIIVYVLRRNLFFMNSEQVNIETEISMSCQEQRGIFQLVSQYIYLFKYKNYLFSYDNLAFSYKIDRALYWCNHFPPFTWKHIESFSSPIYFIMTSIILCRHFVADPTDYNCIWQITWPMGPNLAHSVVLLINVRLKSQVRLNSS